MRLANAPVSWGVFHAETAPLSADAYLDEVAAAGYSGTELGPYGFLPTEPERLNDALAARGLVLEGAVHVHDFAGPNVPLAEAVATTGALLLACGARHLVVMDGGQDYRPEGPDAAAWARLTRALASAHSTAADMGLVLSVHPHVLTAVERLPQIRRLLDETDLPLCLDTGHHAFWGDDPAGFLSEARERIAYVHLKNVDARLRAQVATGVLTPKEALTRGAFCPLDSGAVDIRVFLDRLAATGFAGPVVVEQDWSPALTESAFELAARNAKYLRKAPE